MQSKHDWNMVLNINFDIAKPFCRRKYFGSNMPLKSYVSNRISNTKVFFVQICVSQAGSLAFSLPRVQVRTHLVLIECICPAVDVNHISKNIALSYLIVNIIFMLWHAPIMKWLQKQSDWKSNVCPLTTNDWVQTFVISRRLLVQIEHLNIVCDYDE